ncbi:MULTISPECIES: hypothetical protein [Bradyrhizobium]|uniref:hypothetical protein n=1 Tax=Bradyrhizobium TaxID=374 RepID=UPI000231BD25|nr:hypothetical protein [Bradyrhizobium japonicum]MCS3535531.1 hypothetical protein [Bradyrhizobium japonicum]MCS3988371.1 hypothetical protein [Bradyrhizobium japonicum]MCS4016812.1 hypothetical protein [Bradyrhizobium japonicum]MCS4203908.1 hypothetical protein [Bradyrhizobium japonicum]MDH6179084.1 hypothetical protein [Bradyrhizobium japonicum]
MTITNAQCRAYGNKIREKVEEFYGPRIREVEKMIDEERAAGRDPAAKEIQGGIATINLLKLRGKVNEMKAEAVTSAEVRENACDKEAVPDWIGDAQKVSDIALTVAMLPFVLLTGNMAAAHVDLGEIYKGRPLGGDNALIPKARDDVLDALGIGGDVRKFIQDPWIHTRDFIRDGVFPFGKELEKFVRKPFG